MGKVKAGDKVIATKNFYFCNTIKKGDILEIDRVSGAIFYVKDHKFIGGKQYWLTARDFELVEDDKKYIWYLDDDSGTYFLYDKGLDIVKFNKNGTIAKYIKTGKETSILLTEEEAKQSPSFDKFTKHDPFEDKLYYIRVEDSTDYLIFKPCNNSYVIDRPMFYGDSLYKTKFTEEECDKLIGTSELFYKELVK